MRTEYAGSKNFLIQDNVIIGRDDRYRLYGLAAHREGLIPYGTHLMDSYYGIKVYMDPGTLLHIILLPTFTMALGFPPTEAQRMSKN